MASSNKFSLFERMKSFKHAFNGIKMLLLKEHNARVQITVAILVILAAFLFQIEPFEWLALILSIGFVISMELINTSLEKLADFVEPTWHKNIGEVKDYAAGAVFVSSLTALSVGLVVFCPRVILILSS